MRAIFWLFVACVLGVATHVATLLYAPALSFERSLNRYAADSPPNSFFVMTPEAQAKLLPEYPEDVVFGVCRFDLSKGPMTLDANFPDTLWALTIYSSAGRTLYTADDRQSGVNTFSLRLVKAPSLLEMFTAKEEEDVIADSGWKVSSPDKKGLALFWVPAADPAMRGSITAALAKSKCAGAKA
jgi:uncharacterized membrane protein